MAKTKVDTKETLRTRILAVVGNKSKWALICYHLFEIIKIVKDSIVEIYSALKDHINDKKESLMN